MLLDEFYRYLISKHIVYTGTVSLNPLCCKLKAFCNRLGYLYQNVNFMAGCQNNISPKVRGAAETVINSLSNTLVKKKENIPDLLNYFETDWNISTFIASQHIFKYTRPSFNIKST